jgi:hypothetical protein
LSDQKKIDLKEKARISSGDILDNENRKRRLRNVEK